MSDVMKLAVRVCFLYIRCIMDFHWLELIVILLLILANGFFAASEYALISARKSKIGHLVKKGYKRAESVQNLQSNPDGFIAAIQVGITLVGTLASVVGGATLVEHLTSVLANASIPSISHFANSIAVAIVVASIAFLTLVIGELVPKRLGLQHAEKISLYIAAPINFFMRLMFIPVSILTLSSRFILKILHQDKVPETGHITDEEIVQIITEGRKSGEFSQTEQELVASVFEFSESTVHRVMTPRTDISAINTDWPTEKVLQFITEQGRSRYPAFKDTIDNVIGLIYTKDIINILQHSQLIIIHDILRKPFFVPDSKSLSELLRDFQRKQMHMAIVLDEFGGTAGIITLEDIIEEIVGEIQDEYDTEEQEYQIRPDDSIIISSRMSVGNFNKLTGSRLPEDFADTMGGFIYNYLGDIPRMNQTIEYENLKFTVIEKTGHHIDKFRIVKSDG